MRMDSKRFERSIWTHDVSLNAFALRFRFALVAAVAFSVAVLTTPHSPATAQVSNQSSGSESIPRANPAAWRPSFTPIATSNSNANLNTNLGPNSNATGVLSSGSPSQAAGTAPSLPVNSNALRGNSSNPAAAGTVQSITQSPANNPNNINANNHSASNPIGANVPQEQGPGITRVTSRLDKLPNSAGQVWREYDISPYTSKVSNNEKPQQAILDWVLRETGTEMWFNEPLGILNANKNHLYVYHTPEIQNVVKQIVDRFVRTRAQLQRIDVNLVTVTNPNWRAQSYTMLQPIDVRSPGIEAWMVSKENAAILQGQLSRRADAKQHSGGTLTNHDGQTFVLEKTRPVQFVRNLRWVPNQIPNYQPLMTNINEGYTLAISCLSALDNNTIEATIKCDVDQVEKLNTVKVNLPGAAGKLEQMNLQVPQLVSWRLHERFRWPNDQVLLLSCGIVANPEPDSSGGGGLRFPGFNPKSKRADALLFIEYRGPATGATIPQTANSGLAPIRPR